MRRTSLYFGKPPRTDGSSTAVKLSVVMAARNEERTIGAAIAQVLAVRGAFELELIVVDDGSTDRTLSIASAIDDPRLVVLSHPRSRGKGAAVLSAADVATGTHLLLFDADLEYSADDIPSLVQPILDGLADVVFGARIAGMRTAFSSSRFKLGSAATTVFANLVYDAWLADMHTCLKLVPMPLFRALSLTQQGFGLDTEITGELLRRGIRPYEVPCSYRGRSHAAGKKISVRDGLECLKLIVRVRLRGLVELPFADGEVERVAPAVASLPALPSVVGDHRAPSHRHGLASEAIAEHRGRIIAFSASEESRNGR